jgi:YidC/Oxa1 family membrane protein insertase
MAKLMRETGWNPLGGCLPMLLQFPVMIGLYYALQSSISLRQAPFALWIDDLSRPETLFTIPGLELPVRVLPILMAGSMVLQQKLTPTTSMDPAQQRMMMVMMPLMFGFLFYTFPSGLVLYWFVSNLLAIAQQLWMNRRSQPQPQVAKAKA